MTSFAKVCIDLSNNLRNLRFSKSPSSNTSISSSASASGLANRNADLKSPVNHTSGHHKKQAPPVPPNSQTDEFQSSTESSTVSPRTTQSNRSEKCSVSDMTHSSPISASSQSLTFGTRYKQPEKISALEIDHRVFPSSTDLKRVPSVDRAHQSEIPVSVANGSLQAKPASPNLTTRRFNSSSTNQIIPPASGSRSDEIVNGISPRFSPRITFSPTMAQRVATLARSCQYNYSNSDASSLKSGTSSNCSSPIMPHRGATVAAIKQRLLNQGLKIDLRVPARRYNSTRYRDYMRRVQRGRPVTLEALWEDEKFLTQIFTLLTGEEIIRCCAKMKASKSGPLESITSVSSNENESQIPTWIDPYLEGKLVERLRAGVRRGIPILNVAQMTDRCALLLLNVIKKVLYEWDNPNGVQSEASIIHSECPPTTDRFLQQSICESHDFGIAGGAVVKNEIRQPLTPIRSVSTPSTHPSHAEQRALETTFTSNRSEMGEQETSVDRRDTGVINGKAPIHLFTTLRLQCCSIVDSTLERLVRLFPGLRRLEIQCCNELSELAFWTCLVPSIVSLSVLDCINVSDESFGAITQMLPDLKRLTLQAYHVTDAAFSLFSPRQRDSLESVRLTQCMDVTNQGLINLAFALPSLVVLSVNGCTNLTDDGLEVICENLKHLRALDLACVC
ncbi:F-box and leucine-rich repeat protein 16 [Fasciola gigantica]|uniref:F-box and leucine-rich repeat protein 16 n=1 Tax=Fasciola gigantica TaxID=46835 RepID=A0A504Y3G2_FASGI|nr:F-box and leucine-rich repeat protein 16 [Fasciola gigantica]